MWATSQDVRDRWLAPQPIPASDAQLQILIADAEDVIIREYPDIQSRIDNGDLPLARVVRVVARMVIRVLRNPQGIRQVQQTAGPYQAATTYGGDEPGELYLADEDHADLAPAVRRAFSIDTTPVEAGP